jgi:imidazolonepropionase-like amidohydrolase
MPVALPRAALAAAALLVLGAAALLVLGACTQPRADLVARPESPPPALLVRDVAVLDVATGALAPGRDVLTRGDRIEAIAPAGSIPAPADARLLDGRGATLLPGLIDSHGHVGVGYAPLWRNELPDPAHNLQAYLYCGVTTVLDPSDADEGAVARRDASRRGEIAGPRVYTAGRALTAPGGHPVAMVRDLLPWWIGWYLVPRVAYQVADEAAAREAVAELASSRVDFLKVIVDRIPPTAPRIETPVLRAAVDEARRRSLRAVAHIGTLADARDAAQAGVAAWVHGVYAETLDESGVRELAGFGIPMAPTLAVFESYALANDYARVATPLEREIAPEELLEAFNEPPADPTDYDAFQPFLRLLREQRQGSRENVRRLHAAGVVILAGSDTQSGVLPGAGLHRELALLVEAGLTPAEALRAATLTPARFLEQSDDPDVGQVVPGKRADLLLVDGDPTLDVAAVSRIRAVIQGGVQIERFPLGRRPR